MLEKDFDKYLMDLMKNGKLTDERVELAKRKLLSEEGIEGFLELIGGEDYVSTLSKALTGYCFRNGPVERMHADGKLTEEDMMTLNKFMVNRLGFFLYLLACEGYATINNLLAWDKESTRKWDEPDFEKEMEDYEANMESLVRAKLMFDNAT